MAQKKIQLDTSAKKTWCPGCSNFGILATLKKVINNLHQRGTAMEDIVLVSGIGCSSKIIDYLGLNSFSSLHGRPLVSGEGIKLGNKKLTVIVLAGDGGMYNEGIAHLVHAAKRNVDITLLVHNNRNFALTTSQFTATSPQGFKGGSSPEGSVEEPLNPLALMLSAQASFIGRGYSFRLEGLEQLINKAVRHQGFSFIDILQPCITFFDTTDSYNKRVYAMEEKDLTDEKKALAKIKEWDYQDEKANIPLGIFYKQERPVYENMLLKDLSFSRGDKKINFKKILKEI